jgi:hypothetical protein
MTRRVALACVALGGLCRCSLFFGLDALDNASGPDANMTSTPDATEEGDDEAGDAPPSSSEASDSSTDDESTDSSAPDVASDSTPDTSASADASEASAIDGGRVDGSTDAMAPVDSPPDAPPPPNFVPTSYTGKPFRILTIPGIIYVADYDEGGAGVAFCYSATATGAACGNGLTLSDWCCGTMKGCDDRLQPTLCPIYRQDSDNAGLSHMNAAPDDYAATGPTWISTAQGPSLTGPVAQAGTPVPQDANATKEQDVYLSHTDSGEWVKYTVQVLQAGKYAVGGFMAVPPTTTFSLTFGNGITTNTFAVPASPCTWAGCPSTFHSWAVLSNLATVTFPVAGTYLMTFTIVNNAANPNYFTFVKM